MLKGRQSYEFANPPKISGYAATAGKKEGEGRFGNQFDRIFGDDGATEQSWEKAESLLLNSAVALALDKAGINASAVSYILAGDLLNQCIGTTFALREFNIPFLGLFGACSTMSESMLIASMLMQCGCGNYAVAATSSHFCSAERQFRFPLEYGGQRAPAAQWTVTGSGAVVFGGTSGKCCVTRVTIGKIVDKGIFDAANMGAAMAPAFVDTVISHFEDTGIKPSDYDLIVSGDLGKTGKKLAASLFEQNGYKLGDRLFDCGAEMFLDQQDAHAGGSGCGCAASVLCAHLLPQIESGKLKKILFCATGALMSTVSSQQGESIPGICHAVAIETCYS